MEGCIIPMLTRCMIHRVEVGQLNRMAGLTQCLDGYITHGGVERGRIWMCVDNQCVHGIGG